MTAEQLNDALANERTVHPHRANAHSGTTSHYVGRHRDAILDRVPMVEPDYAPDETTSGWLDN